jgi:hypothetical protein
MHALRAERPGWMHRLGAQGVVWMHALRAAGRRDAGAGGRAWRGCTRPRSGRVRADRLEGADKLEGADRHMSRTERAPVRRGVLVSERVLADRHMSRTERAPVRRGVLCAGTFKEADPRTLPQTGTLPQPRRALAPEFGIERVAPTLACPPPTPRRCTSRCLQSGTALIAEEKSSAGRRARPGAAEPRNGTPDMASCRVARRRSREPVHHPPSQGWVIPHSCTSGLHVLPSRTFVLGLGLAVRQGLRPASAVHSARRTTRTRHTPEGAGRSMESTI